ncbi:unnamed protein product [Fraxinus pennsylvanica]|uniref:Cyclin-dependent kinase inhibitor domain-containing protein n=1 Tax=Fraxinus pennsylvanica TaxID=56036 RepID=A0AAD2ED92_9LAMI|nr:unnamed protein product [Fraxinus pennsylvanica]
MGEQLRKCKSEKVMEGGAENKAMAEVNNESDFVKENLSSSDLKTDGYETEISVPINNVYSRETSPTREIYGDSEKSLMVFLPQSKKKEPSSPTNSRQIISSADGKMPSAKELEEFFAAEEKYQQQLFAEKYNYDVVNDVPLEGRYEWVRLKP